MTDQSASLSSIARNTLAKLTFWRAFGLAVVAFVIGSALMQTESMRSAFEPEQIARITIEGMIQENRDQLKMLEKLAKNDHVKGVLVYVNSPGGTTAGGEAIYEGLRKIADKKPVVAQFGTLAASAGYIVGMGTDHIVARGNTITGSIGVIAQWPEVSGLLDKLGVKVNEVKSGNLKATPSMFLPLDENGRKVTEGMVNESFKWFLSLVETRRGIKTAEVEGLEQGRIFSGREALKVKLVDEIGGEDQAVAWLVSKGVAKDLKVVNWKPGTRPWGIAGITGSLPGTSDRLTASDVARALMSAAHLDAVELDGMISVWHP